MRGQLTEKAEVFAFGVVALEAVSFGQPNTSNSLEESGIYILERVSCSTILPSIYPGELMNPFLVLTVTECCCAYVNLTGLGPVRRGATTANPGPKAGEVRRRGSSESHPCRAHVHAGLAAPAAADVEGGGDAYRESRGG